MEQDLEPGRENPPVQYAVNLTLSGTRQVYTDPHEAGAAYFAADPAERPSVTYSDTSSARTMARTGIVGQREDGSPNYAKSLPDSHGPDAEFRAGYFGAMEVSLSDRLGKIDWTSEGHETGDPLGQDLKADLEAFARHAPEKAAALWSETTASPAPGPILRAAVQDQENTAGVAAQDDISDGPRIIAMGDWVTTDQNVELRPIAVESERGIHAGYEASFAGGDGAIAFSEQTFASSREALRHSWDFYEGEEAGLTRAVQQAAERDRDFIDDVEHEPRNRDEGPEIGAWFPDGEPVGEENTRPQAERPPFAASADHERGDAAPWQDPSKAIADWIEQSSAKIAQVPAAQQHDLRQEMQEIAREAAAAFGAEQAHETQSAVPPRSTLYSARVSPNALTLGTEETALAPEAALTLTTTLKSAAQAVGIDAAKIERRLEAGAADRGEEARWVASDISEVAARHWLNLGDEGARSKAASLVDQFYERAAEMIHAVRASEHAHDADPLREALTSMAKVHAGQGAVSFRTEEQARDFTEEMKVRYGETVIKELAAGRTDALAQDVSDPTARKAIAQAVVAAAKEHPALGLSAQEVDAAEHRVSAQARDHERPKEHALEREI